MKIIIISDSHGKKDKINDIVKNHHYDFLFFLGDGIADLGNLAHATNTKIVKGNCDYFSDYPIYEIVKLKDNTILLTHGHVQKVKSNLNNLIVLAKQLKANYVFYGHTHTPFHKKIDGITFINPGSLYKNKDKSSSFGIFTLKNQENDFNLIEF